MSSIEEPIHQTNYPLGAAVAAAPNGTATEKGRSTLTVIGCGKSLLNHHFSIPDFDVS